MHAEAERSRSKKRLSNFLDFLDFLDSSNTRGE